MKAYYHVFDKIQTHNVSYRIFYCKVFVRILICPLFRYAFPPRPFHIDALDHRITESEAHGAYIRYTDDFLLFGNDKQRLFSPA